MEIVTEKLQNVGDVMEQNIRGVQIGCYSVALIGFGIALRKVRPFTRFKSPGQIPDHFIKEKRQLTGIVERIEPNENILLVKHKPLINLPLITTKSLLPVKISGVKVTGLGTNWLQAIVVGNEIKFTPIYKNERNVQCEVKISKQIFDKKKQMRLVSVDVAESLLKIGFATRERLPNDAAFLTYSNLLKHAENYALKKRLGAKYYVMMLGNVTLYFGKSLLDFVNFLSRKMPKQMPKVVAS